jgi:transcriptional regulator with XRE-family HTH domain
MFRRIRDLREDKDWTQKQVAVYLTCSQQVYSNYELGQRDIPTHVLIALAKLHKTSVDYILGVTDNPKPYKGDKSGKVF